MPPQSPRTDFKAACALLTTEVARGTGFLVSAERLLTCNHVIKHACDDLVRVIFPHGEYEATVELIDARNDCALLRLLRPVPSTDAQPLQLATFAVHKASEWEGYGFPAATGQAGLLIDGRVQDPDGHDPALRPAVVLQSANVTAGCGLQGFSGSPVLVGGKVIGQMRQIIPDEAGGAQLAVVYACPAGLLADLVRRRLGTEAFQAPNPYRGLSAFRPEDAQVFFGREVLTAKLKQRFRALRGSADECRLLAVLGPSGSGKSSVTLAGLVPALRQGPEPVRIAIFKPGSRLVESLARALVPLLPPDTAVLPASRQVAIERLLYSQEVPGEGLRRFAADLTDIASMPLVIVVDQFEEVYTLCKNAAERDTFVQSLLHAASDENRHVSIILTMRSDFFGETQRQHPELNRAIAAQHELVPTMNSKELHRAIAEPARQAGRPLDGAVIDLLLSQANGSEGALPLLEFALTRIWVGLADGKEPAATLHEIGGVGGALAQQAQALYDRLSLSEQRIVKRAFVRMVQLGEGTRDTRRRVALSDLCGHGENEAEVLALLRPLADERTRLITLSGYGDHSTVVMAEVTHEALFEHWVALRQWIDESRVDHRFHDRIAEAARLWHRADRPSGRLWRPPDLDLLHEYVTRHPNELTAREFEFYEASSKQQIAEQAAKQEAEQRLMDAYEKLRQQLLSTYVERGRQLLLQGEALQSLLWLQRAYDQGCAVPSLRYLLAEAMRPVDAAQSVLVGHLDRAIHAAFSPNGERVVTASWDSTARVWDPTTGQLLASLTGHAQRVSHVAFDTDGGRVVTASDDHTARVWDAKTGRLLAKLSDHADSVSHAAFSLDGGRVVTASRDKTARVWDATTGQLRATLTGHSDRIWYAAFNPDGARVVTVSADKTARVWDATNGHLVMKLKGHADSVVHAEFSPDGARIVTASDDKTARVWNAMTGSLELQLKSHVDSVVSAKFSSDAACVVTASWDRTARVWDATTGHLLATLSGHADSVVYAEFSRDGARVVTASDDHTARVWDATTGQLLAALMGHADRVRHAEFGPDGTCVITASVDKTARVWDTRKIDQMLVALLGHRDKVRHAGFSRDGAHVVTASDDHTARLWDVKTGHLLVALLGHVDNVVHAEFSPDGARVVTASADKTARLWDAKTGHLLAALLNQGHGVLSARFNSDGTRVVTASAGKTARLWDAITGHLLAELLGHADRVRTALFSPDGTRVVTASADKTARLWDAMTGQLLAVLEGHTHAVGHAEFSPDGTRVVTASADKTARVWNATTGQLLAALSAHTDRVGYAEFSPDGARVLTASEDKMARVWNATTGQLLAALQGHAARVGHAKFSPDGALVVTSSADRTARLWDATTGHLLGSLVCHSRSVENSEFSPDGSRVVTASADKTVRLWDVHLETRAASQVAAGILSKVPLRFQGDVLVPSIPEYEKCPKS